MKYSTEPILWNDTLMEPNEMNCKEVLSWISEFEAYGGTCTIDAIRVSIDPIHNDINSFEIRPSGILLLDML